MHPFSPLDIVALAVFACTWVGYALIVEGTKVGNKGLSVRMNLYRELWMRRMLARDMRMVDMQIMASLQNGTAFFASTTLIAIGGVLTLLRSTDEMLSTVSALPFGVPVSHELWEIKTVGLILILVYAFFKFAWSYRLFNYVAILLGATPPAAEKDSAEAEAHIERTAKMFTAAGRHFNRGQRAFFFALGYLGWFVNPAVFLVTTLVVAAVTARRQFASDSLAALKGE